jgi:hypothetical protein
MEYEFKKSLRIAGKTFLKGVREVQAEVESHPHFEKYVGLALIAEPKHKSQIQDSESFTARNERLAARFKAQRANASTTENAEPVQEGVQAEPVKAKPGRKPKSEAQE